MHLAHVAAAQHLAARDTDRLFTFSPDEVAEAERRAVRRAGGVAAARSERAVAAPTRHPLTERGRHVAPRPARV